MIQFECKGTSTILRPTDISGGSRIITPRGYSVKVPILSLDENNTKIVKKNTKSIPINKTSFNKLSPYMYYVNHKFHQNNNINPIPINKNIIL